MGLSSNSGVFKLFGIYCLKVKYISPLHSKATWAPGSNKKGYFYGRDDPWRLLGWVMS
jgi:hypothetical protein